MPSSAIACCSSASSGSFESLGIEPTSLTGHEVAVTDFVNVTGEPAVAWLAAGIAVALGGIIRDVVSTLADRGTFGEALAVPATGYAAVYVLEIALLLATFAAMATLIGSLRRGAPAGPFTEEYERKTS